MSEPPSDPRLLFTPSPEKTKKTSTNSPAPSGSSEPVTPPKPKPRTSTSRLEVFIDPPSLSSEDRKQYKDLAPDKTLTSMPPLNEIIGEYDDGKKLYYYARYEGGIAHKYSSKDIYAHYSDILKEYERKKKAGTLESFDPNAHYVHPNSRVKLMLNLTAKRDPIKATYFYSRSKKSSADSDEVPDSQEENEDEENDSHEGTDEEEYGDDESPVKVRRSTRGKATKSLPFSPKKTRSKVIYTISDSEDGDGRDSVAPRRSSRVRKGVKINLDDDYSEEDKESEDSDAYASGRKSKSKAKKVKKPPRKKDARPAYGHVREVAELAYDVDSDDESSQLRAHRDMCEKCHQGPAHRLLVENKTKPKGRKRRKTSDDEFEESGNEEERIAALGGWVRCLKCPVTAHWRCLASTQRDEILKAARDKDREVWRATQSKSDLFDEDGKPKPNKDEPGKRPGLDVYETTEFICGSCMKGGVCMGCMGTALEPDTSLQAKDDSAKLSGLAKPDASGTGESSSATNGDIEMADGTQILAPPSRAPSPEDTSSSALLFRCLTCKRLAHYEHLPPPTPNATTSEIAHYYQVTCNWLCADCVSYQYPLDKIIAWRPYPANAVDPPRPKGEPPNYKLPLPREYLVKWADRGYRRVQWVPHMYLVSTHPAKLKNFLAGGTKVQLLEEPVDDETVVLANGENSSAPDFEIVAEESRESSTKPQPKTPALPSDAIPDAERRIPLGWKTIDRVLDLQLWKTRPMQSKKAKGKRRQIVVNDEDEDEILDAAFEKGEEPDSSYLESVNEYEARTKRKFGMECINQVVWVYIKWDDLGYDEATWDSPPRENGFGYSAFLIALERFIISRTVTVPRVPSGMKLKSMRKDGDYKKYVLRDAADLDLGQDPKLKLMPFQVDGFNWLCSNWWDLQHCILADEMGLGKTVQIATFIGRLVKDWKAFPALVVVPNSTITNWVREFTRWAPNLRVVPFYGEAKARDVIKKFELNHDKKQQNTTGAKYHVLVTTYEALLNPKDFTSVFKNQPRWEVLVIDEGQRLKSDTSLLFKKLNELNSIHRIIMTGTPLNNNMRELFNLMNFLDPENWSDLEALEKEHEELTEELVKVLHNRLRPYFLRRIKSEVLQLPPKNEVIVPVSMAPLQREIYRSILSHNLEILNGLAQPSDSKVAGQPKARINNVLMQLRKCLQHPYLYAEDIEPRGLGKEETHEKLIDGSAKLRLLKTLLPKLKARGHRVLLFSQFVIALDVIEDFLNGEGLKYLRLDGNTKGTDRQKGMDEFNRPGSDVFIYLLTTRAGGVGINLFSADTVIIFDPDFNPHQDLQAIARAYRYGQQKTCLVFKLMVKDSAEERIVQVGKKKLVLDHLIVQKMDDDDDSAGENVQSILTFGAKALFEAEEGARDIIYTDQDIDKLIERTEKEGDQQETVKEGGLSFAFAKIWAADKDSLEEVEDEVPEGQEDSWAQTLQRITAEREKAQIQEVALAGRGARRKAAMKTQHLYLDGDTPVKPKKSHKKGSKTTSLQSEGSAYSGSDAGSDGDPSDGTAELTPEELSALKELKEKSSTDKVPVPQRKAGLVSPPKRHSSAKDHTPLNSIQNYDKHDTPELCGLCGTFHGDAPGDCPMTDKSENLVAYREMLMLHAEYETREDRLKAIDAIEKILLKRGHIHLITGQPLHFVERASVIAPPKRVKPPAKPRPSAQASISSEPASNVAGPSKRASSPLPEGPAKKQKTFPDPHTSLPISGFPPVSRRNSTPIMSNGAPLVSEPPKKKKRKSTSSATAQLLAMTSAMKPRSPSPVAGPSKRAPSPTILPDESTKKKAKQTSGPGCSVCGQGHHLLKKCPMIMIGPKSTAKEIARLENDPEKIETVNTLRKILEKQEKRIRKEAPAPKPAKAVEASSDAIEISD